MWVNRYLLEYSLDFSQFQTYPQSATSLNLKYQTRPQLVNYP